MQVKYTQKDAFFPDGVRPNNDQCVRILLHKLCGQTHSPTDHFSLWWKGIRGIAVPAGGTNVRYYLHYYMYITQCFWCKSNCYKFKLGLNIYIIIINKGFILYASISCTQFRAPYNAVILHGPVYTQGE